MDDLTKLCDELERCKREKSCYENEIACVKAKLNTFVDGDHNKLLRLKAQLKIHNAYKSNEYGLISFIISVVTLALMIISEATDKISIEYALIGMGGLLLILVVHLIDMWAENKFGYRKNWMKYIEVVLEDMDK
ncbi:MAG: hypothetical protein ACI39H_01545 [Lachnospiraceae bacterium]